MKKKILLLFSCLTIFFLGFIVLDKTTIKYNIVPADRKIAAPNFTQLEAVSDLIIKATILPEKENKLDVTEKGIPYFGYTLTKIRIDDVYYGNVSKDDILTITEEYYITDAPIGKLIHTQENYMPAKIGQQYIFFLVKYPYDTRYKDMYFPLELEKGKYLISDKTKDAFTINALSNKELEVGKKDSTEYKKWFKKVIEKYVKRNRL